MVSIADVLLSTLITWGLHIGAAHPGAEGDVQSRGPEINDELKGELWC